MKLGIFFNILFPPPLDVLNLLHEVRPHAGKTESCDLSMTIGNFHRAKTKQPSDLDMKLSHATLS